MVRRSGSGPPTSPSSPPGASRARPSRYGRSAGRQARVSFGKPGKHSSRMGSSTQPVIAFATRTFEPPGLEIRVNFGVFAGREATPAEIDELAEAVRDKVGEVSIVSEDRHEFGEHSAAEVHQVRIELRADQLPSGEEELFELQGRLVESAERWARNCFENRHAE